MERKYKKFSFEIDSEDPDLTTLIGKDANFVFNPNTKNGEELTAFLSGCEEIPNTSQQIEKLEADKAELVELLKIFVEENTPITTSHAYEFPEYMMKAKSLMQKHKK